MLHIEFDGWSGDDLLCVGLSYLVTTRMRIWLEELGGSGYEFDSVQVTVSREYRQLYGNEALPEFH